jgi:hypothetical protein
MMPQEPTMLSEQLRELAGKATPGDWVIEEDPVQDGSHMTLVATPGKHGCNGTWIASTFHNWNYTDYGERRISWKEAESNAALIALLASNLPAIITALEAQEKLK